MSLNRDELIKMDLTNVGRYSFSRLSTYHTCQYQYNEHYNNKESGENNTFAGYGTMAHEILEKYYNGDLKAEDMKEEYQKGFSEECGDGVIMYAPKKDGDYFEKDLTELYYNSGLEYFSDFEGFDDLNILGVEEEFSFLLSYNDVNFILGGFIDLVAEKDGYLYVIDHKSKGKFKSKAEKKKYRRQLALYSLAAERKWGKPVKEVWFNQFRLNHIEKFKLDDEMVEEALMWATDTVKAIESEFMWLPNTSDKFYCKNLCDIREKCPYFNHK